MLRLCDIPVTPKTAGAAAGSPRRRFLRRSAALAAIVTAASVSLPTSAHAAGVVYEPVSVPDGAAVPLSGRAGVDEAFVLGTGDAATFRVHGPGRLRILASLLLDPSTPTPTDPRVLVVLDGAGKPFALKTTRADGLTLPADRFRAARPSEPAVIALKLDERVRELSFRLPPGAGHRVLVAFEASRRAPESSGPVATAAPAADTEAAELDALFDPLAGIDLVPIAPVGDEAVEKTEPLAQASVTDQNGAARAPSVSTPDPARTAGADAVASAAPSADRSSGATGWSGSAPSSGADRSGSDRSSSANTSWAAAAPREPDDGSVPLGFVVVPMDGVPTARPPAAERSPSFFSGVELIPRAGYSLGRDRLTGLGLYQLELSTRLDAWKLPMFRLALATGYAAFAGAWRGTEPGRGFGRFQQASTVVPLELGLVLEPFRRAAVSPYLGAAFTSGFVHTAYRRYSLPEETTGGVLLAGTASLGIRLRAKGIVALVELRHTEGQTGLDGALASAQGVLSSTALMGGFGLAFR